MLMHARGVEVVGRDTNSGVGGTDLGLATIEI